MDGKLVDTTVGRIIVKEILPPSIKFEEINKVVDSNRLSDLIGICYRRSGSKETVILADRLKDLGYQYATKAGISICIDDMKIPSRKGVLLDSAYEEVKEIQKQYNEGLITDGERYNKVIDIWAQATEEIAEEMLRELSTDLIKDENGKEAMVPSFLAVLVLDEVE